MVNMWLLYSNHRYQSHNKDVDYSNCLHILFLAVKRQKCSMRNSTIEMLFKSYRIIRCAPVSIWESFVLDGDRLMCHRGAKALLSIVEQWEEIDSVPSLVLQVSPGDPLPFEELICPGGRRLNLNVWLVTDKCCLSEPPLGRKYEKGKPPSCFHNILHQIEHSWTGRLQTGNWFSLVVVVRTKVKWMSQKPNLTMTYLNEGLQIFCLQARPLVKLILHVMCLTALGNNVLLTKEREERRRRRRKKE